MVSDFEKKPNSVVCMYVCISAIMAYTRCYKIFFLKIIWWKSLLLSVFHINMVVVLFFIHEGYSPNPIVQYHIARIPVHTICDIFDQGTLDSKVQISLLVGAQVSLLVGLQVSLLVALEYKFHCWLEYKFHCWKDVVDSIHL